MGLKTKLSMRRFLRRSDGSSALEFALVAPVFIMMMIGILEISVMAFASSLLEGGLREAARFGITGLPPGGGTREQAIVNIINQHGVGFVTVTTADVSNKVYPNFSDIGQPEPYDDLDSSGDISTGDTYEDVNCSGTWESDMASVGAGQGSDVVIFQVDYQHPMLTGLLSPFMGSGGKVPLSASVAVRNEPFNTGTTSCGTLTY